MSIRTIAGYGLAIGLLAGLSGCVPAYYPAYPAYYQRPAYQYHRAPSQTPTGTQPRGSEWLNPEPAR